MSIGIISQSTVERENETKDLFEEIKPLLDDGWIYSNAVKKVKGIDDKKLCFNRYQQAWFRDLVDYGETQGYRWEDYSGK